MKVGLQYVGKKQVPFTYENVNLRFERQLTWKDRKTTLWVEKEDADFIFKHNPYGFVKKVGERSDDVEPAPALVEENEPEPPKPDLICPVCHKTYHDLMWYEKHVAKCMKPEEMKDEQDAPQA